MRIRSVAAATTVALALAVIAAVPAASATVGIAPVADAQVSNESPTTNFGSYHRLWADHTAPTRISYLRFNVTSIPAGCTVDKVTLRLTVGPDYNNGSAYGGDLHAVADSSWSEAGLTWNTKPALGATVNSVAGRVALGQAVTWDASALVRGNGLVSMALTSPNQDGAAYDSRETGTAGPALNITTSCSTPSPTPTPTTTSPAPTPSPTVTSPAPSPTPVTGVPQWDHVVILMEENHSYSETASLPYFASLRAQGADFTNSHGITHPSEPNYLALWSGSTQGISSDVCPTDLGAKASLGSQLLAAGKSVGGYMEGLPADGSLVCSDSAGAYVRNHNPLADFAATSDAAHNKTFASFPSTAAGYAALPSVSLISPSLRNDMHNGTLAQADTWAQAHLDGYVQWAKSHNSLFILDTDENDGATGNQILTVFVGAHIVPGAYAQNINHYTVLSTIEDAFGLSRLNPATPATGMFR